MIVQNILRHGVILNHDCAFGKLDLLWVFLNVGIPGCGSVWKSEVAPELAAEDVLGF